jgi:hypothetical protein
LWAVAAPADLFGLVAAVLDQFFMEHLFKLHQLQVTQYK